MESMDCTSYFTSAPNTFGYVGFVNDANLPNGHGVSSESNAPIQSMELEQNFEASLSNFMPAVFDYNFDGPMRSHGNNGTKCNIASAIIRQDSSSSTSSSPGQNLSSMLISGNDSMDSGMSLDHDGETTLVGREDRRSNSVDKELLTPAQSRRKAQNRAAQRAFRERKERHVRDLEAKLHQLTSTTASLQSDNERLRLLLQRTQTENEVLKATASPARQHNHHHLPCFVDDPHSLPSSRSSTSSRSTTSDDDHFATVNRSSPAEPPSSTPSSMTSPQSDNANTSSIAHTNNPRKLTPHAAWEILQLHPLFARGILDISLVCERLKQLARSDDMTGGPMFDEEEVRAVVEEMGKDGEEGLE